MKLILPEQQTKTREVKAVLSRSGNLYFQKDGEWWFFDLEVVTIEKSMRQSTEHILALTGATPLYSGDHVTLEI